MGQLHVLCITQGDSIIFCCFIYPLLLYLPTTVQKGSTLSALIILTWILALFFKKRKSQLIPSPALKAEESKCRLKLVLCQFTLSHTHTHTASDPCVFPTQCYYIEYGFATLPSQHAKYLSVIYGLEPRRKGQDT